MNRDSKGRFRKARNITATIIIGGAIGIIAFNTPILEKLDAAMKGGKIEAHNPVATIATVVKAEAAETTAARIEAKKWEIVDALASECETKGKPEPDAVIIFDSNNAASIGAWQYQIKTMQHYVSVFENRTISRTEAIAYAIDHAKARALTFRIVWEDSKGIDNWYNCAHVKNDFAERVAYIKQVEKDFIK